MMLFQRRLFLELLRNALTTLGLLTVILVLVMSTQAVTRTEGLSLLLFARLVPMLSAAQVDVTLPLAVLVAVVLTYGRAAADNEVDTLRASGVHPAQVGLPALVFGALMAVALLLAVDVAKPWAETAKRRIAKDVPLADLVRNKLTAGEPVKLDNRTLVSADGLGVDGQLQGVRVQMYGGEGDLERELFAEEAELGVQQARGELTVTLRRFHTVSGPRFEGAETTITRPLARELVELDSRHLSTAQLMASLRRGGPLAGFTARQAELAVHMRLSAALACVLFTLIGMPLALLYRRGDRTGAFLIAFLVALFVYFPAREVSLYLADRDVLSPAAAAWAGSAVLLVLGGALCRRVLLR